MKMLDWIRITTGALSWCVAALVACAPACAASSSEVRDARRSGYDADFIVVYDAVLATVRALYPHLSEDPITGEIKTAWHPVRLSSEQAGPSSTQPASRSLNPMSATSVPHKQYFIRFTLKVVGGDPWRVSVQGQASEWGAGGVPAELVGGNEPPWLKGRVDALQVAVHRRLRQHAVILESTAQVAAQAPAAQEPQGPAIDVGHLPREAARAVMAALGAARALDHAALRAVMHPRCTWSLGAPPDAQQAVLMWQADASLLGQLVAIIEAGCELAPGNSAEVRCPAADARASGYRAVFARGPDGAWKMTMFAAED